MHRFSSGGPPAARKPPHAPFVRSVGRPSPGAPEPQGSHKRWPTGFAHAGSVARAPRRTRCRLTFAPLVPPTPPQAPNQPPWPHPLRVRTFHVLSRRPFWTSRHACPALLSPSRAHPAPLPCPRAAGSASHQPGGAVSLGSGGPSPPGAILVSKVLTYSDVSTEVARTGRIVLPRIQVQQCLPELLALCRAEGVLPALRGGGPVKLSVDLVRGSRLPACLPGTAACAGPRHSQLAGAANVLPAVSSAAVVRGAFAVPELPLLVQIPPSPLACSAPPLSPHHSCRPPHPHLPPSPSRRPQVVEDEAGRSWVLLMKTWQNVVSGEHRPTFVLENTGAWLARGLAADSARAGCLAGSGCCMPGCG